SGLLIARNPVLGLRRTVGDDDRRSLVHISEMDTDRIPFAAHELGILVAELAPRRLGLRALAEDAGVRRQHARRQHAFEILGCLGHVADRDRALLGLVGSEKMPAAPAFYHRGELP